MDRKQLFLALAACFVMGCSAPYSKPRKLSEEDAVKTIAKSAKGYELYSWQATGAWNFVLVDATNSFKTFEEVTTQFSVVKGEEDLLKIINSLSEGELVYWNLRRIKGFEYPPEEIMKKVVKLCDKRNIRLEIIEW